VSTPAIVVKDLHKTYRIFRRPGDVLIEGITGRKRHEAFEALKGVSFEVNKGEVLGILGRNGAGKSTLLKVMTGATAATSGSIVVNGRISQMLELGTGFHLDYSGRDNIYFGGFCLGMSRSEIDRKFASIVAFSELGEFIERPFRTYSLGMQARLTFAVAIHVDPEVLIIDEWLAVGDARFAMKCYGRIRELRDSGATVVFVTHNYSTVVEFCDRALILDGGRIHFEGPPVETVRAYSKLLFGEEKSGGAAPSLQHEARAYPDAGNAPFEGQEALNAIDHDFTARFGDGRARIKAMAISDGERLTSVLSSGDDFQLRVFVDVFDRLDEIVLGVFIRDRLGRIISSTTNHCFGEEQRVRATPAGAQLVAEFKAKMTLSAGYYFVGAALAQADGQKYDVVDNLIMLEVVNSPRMLAESVSNIFPSLNIKITAPAEKAAATSSTAS
jgi:ABC-type polysaccharide/polyol phosphate transport system ATPase subunit